MLGRRPGSGCSTFLETIANNRESYASVNGDVSYGGIPASEQKNDFPGQVTYHMEDDVHFTSMSVWQTRVFAIYTKTNKENDRRDSNHCGSTYGGGVWNQPYEVHSRR